MAMHSDVWRSSVLVIGLLAASGSTSTEALADSPRIQFDMPSITSAVDTTCGSECNQVSFDLVLSSLVVDVRDGSPNQPPPIDHLLVRCSMRDASPIVDYSPRTELQSDFAGPIAIHNKQEKDDAVRLGVDAVYPPLGGATLSADEKVSKSDSTQFQRQPPMQAVVASGTTDRGRGVYFKLRWTAQQVLEGEKQFRISIAVPPTWRGGLVDVRVIAHGRERQLFGPPKLDTIASSRFVVAVHRQDDHEAASIARRLADLDRQLASYAGRVSNGGGALSELFQRVFTPESKPQLPGRWYERLTRDSADPYFDKQIRALPMPVRVAVLDYDEANRKLKQLSGEESS